MRKSVSVRSVIETPLPVAGYHVRLHVRELADGYSCTVAWTSEFEASGAPESDAVKLIRGLYEAATTLVAGRIPDWRAIVEAGPSAQVSATLRQLELLESGSAGNMRESRISTAAHSAERFGMCGRLTVWSGES